MQHRMQTRFYSSGKDPHVQTWSEYMGHRSDDDDNPWANLDSFADSAVAVSIPKPARVERTDVSESPKSEASTNSVSEFEREMMQAAAFRALAEQGFEPHFESSTEPPSAAPKATYLTPALTHVNTATGSINMVDVSDKSETKRSATARGRVWLPTEGIRAIFDVEQGRSTGALSKGPVLHTAQLAGIMGAKQTSSLIPLCHPLRLTKVDVELAFEQDAIALADGTGDGGEGGGYLVIECTATTTDKTGVEMEALTGVSTAALTIWDMCKAVAGREMVIDDIKVIRKSGGKSGDWQRS